MSRPRPHLAVLASLALAAVFGGIAALAGDGVDVAAVAVLSMLGIAADYAAARLGALVHVSALGIVVFFAAARYGAPTAGLVGLIGVVGAWALDRYRLVSVSVNVAAVAVPGVVAALIVDAMGGPIVLAAAVATAAGTVANVAVAGPLIAVQDGLAFRSLLASVRGYAATLGFQVAFVAVLAKADTRSHVDAVVLAILFAATYANMGILVSRAQREVVRTADESRRNAALSLGVLSSLIHTLEARDPRAARHCAAVARYARDLVRAVGLDGHTQEVAHTAGLLHDIGRFTLSDRVLEGNGPLTARDWEQIAEHPARGAELLRDLDAYGPIAEVVASHHERWDGHGYPAGLAGDAIPQLARVIAVCEVYDTLTGPDTYRAPPLSSFEALRELRRVAGSQLDPDLVEQFATLLAGTDAAYRHAEAADSDAELEVARAITERTESKTPLK